LLIAIAGLELGRWCIKQFLLGVVEPLTLDVSAGKEFRKILWRIQVL